MIIIILIIVSKWSYSLSPEGEIYILSRCVENKLSVPIHKTIEDIQLCPCKACMDKEVEIREEKLKKILLSKGWNDDERDLKVRDWFEEIEDSFNKRLKKVGKCVGDKINKKKKQKTSLKKVIVNLLNLQKTGYKVPKKILESIIKIIEGDKEIELNEESYEAFCLLYVEDQKLKDEIEIWKKSPNGKLVEECWSRVSQIKIKDRDVVKDPLGNLVYQVGSNCANLRAKYHLMKVAVHQEKDIQQVGQLLKNKELEKLKNLKNLDMLGILACMKGLINIAEREVVLSIDFHFKKALDPQVFLFGTFYNRSGSEQFFINRERKGREAVWNPLLTSCGNKTMELRKLVANIEQGKFRSVSISSENKSINNGRIKEGVDKFLRKLKKLPPHLCMVIKVMGRDAEFKRNDVPKTIFENRKEGSTLILPPHLLEMLHECLTKEPLYVRHSYGHMARLKEFSEIYSSKGARPLMVNSSYFLKNAEEVHGRVCSEFVKLEHDYVHISEYLGLHKEDYPRSCIQELLAPFLIEHKKELSWVDVEGFCVYVKAYIESLLEGVRAESILTSVYEKFFFQQKDNRQVVDIPKILNYILGQKEGLKEQFLKSLWEKYEGVLKEYDSLKWWENDQAWQKLEEYLLEKKESVEEVSGIAEWISTEDNESEDENRDVIESDESDEMEEIERFWMEMEKIKRRRIDEDLNKDEIEEFYRRKCQMREGKGFFKKIKQLRSLLETRDIEKSA